jgi:hypothetical protein
MAKLQTEIMEKEVKTSRQETIKNSVRKGKIIGSSLKNLENNYRNMQDELFEKAKNEEITLEDITNTMNALKKVTTAKKEMESFIETTKNYDDGILSEIDREKVYHYYKTGDFTQVELSKIFNTNQPMISRIINEKDKK